MASMRDVQALTVALKLTSTYGPGEAGKHAAEIIDELRIGGWVILPLTITTSTTLSPSISGTSPAPRAPGKEGV